MRITTFDEVITRLDRIRDTISELIDKLADDSKNASSYEESDSLWSDRNKMLWRNEYAYDIRYKMIVFIDYVDLIEELESEKDKFLVQKTFKYYDEGLKDQFESDIKLLKTSKLTDYRCVNLLRELIDWYEAAQEYFESI